MKRKNWRGALKLDFSQGSALKEALLADLLRRPGAPQDMKEDASMNTTIKHSTRTLIFALVAVLLLSGAALAAIRTFSLGPFASYTQSDDADVKPSGLGEEDGKVVSRAADAPAEPRIAYVHFGTLDEVRPHLNKALNPALPTSLPDGYALDRFSVFADEDGKPYENTEYLYITYRNQGKEIKIGLRLMNDNTAFESTGSAPLTALTVNGHSAILDGKNLSVLIGDVLYEFSTRDSSLTTDDQIRMAESIRG